MATFILHFVNSRGTNINKRPIFFTTFSLVLAVDVTLIDTRRIFFSWFLHCVEILGTREKGGRLSLAWASLLSIFLSDFFWIGTYTVDMVRWSASRRRPIPVQMQRPFCISFVSLKNCAIPVDLGGAFWRNFSVCPIWSNNALFIHSKVKQNRRI